jgi:hypothetical protein
MYYYILEQLELVHTTTLAYSTYISADTISYENVITRNGQYLD